MSILIAYLIIGLTFVAGFWQGYKDNTDDFNVVDYVFMTISFCILWPVVVREMNKLELQF